MAISIIDDRELWDSTVDQSPYGLLFHKWDFLKIAEKHTGWMLLPYGVYKGDRLLSLFPLFYKRDLLIKSVFSPPPLSCIPYLGPTMNAGYGDLKPSTRESHLQAVVDEVTASIKKLSPSYVYVQMPPMYNDIRPFTWNGYSEVSHHTYFIDLKPPLEKILAGFDKNLRWTLKKVGELPLQAGAGVRCGDILRHRRETLRGAGPHLPDRQPAVPEGPAGYSSRRTCRCTSCTTARRSPR